MLSRCNRIYILLCFSPSTYTYAELFQPSFLLWHNYWEPQLIPSKQMCYQIFGRFLNPLFEISIIIILVSRKSLFEVANTHSQIVYGCNRHDCEFDAVSKAKQHSARVTDEQSKAKNRWSCARENSKNPLLCI